LDIYSAALKLCVLVIVTIATITDLKYRKIPNKLTFPASFVGIVAQAAYFASFATPTDMWFRAGVGALNGVLGWFTGVFIMSSTKFFMRKFGHGDTKLVAAVGAFLGPGPVFIIYLYYSLVFGFFSLIQMIRAIPWKDMWMAEQARQAGVTPPQINMEPLNKVRKEIIPVGPFIAIGTGLAMIFEQQTLAFLGFK
jgi:prepilin peptidase CpaA